MLSDLASYFEVISKYLGHLMKEEHTTDYLAGVSCQWRFIQAHAIWETCTGTLKAGVSNFGVPLLVTRDELFYCINCIRSCHK